MYGRYVILVAPDEFANGKCRVKDMRAAEDDPNKQVDLDIAALVEQLSEKGIAPIGQATVVA